MLRVVALTATLAVLLLGGAGTVGAHPELAESLGLASSPAVPGGLDELRAAGAYDSTAIAWPFVLALASIIGVLARRRSRRVAAAALAVVLVVFAVESAQHTVHHAFNDRPVACPTALIATHLNGTTVEGLAVDAPILLVGARLDSPDQRVSPLGSFALQHGRAPPSALA